jgi:molybdopterin/thiamine biosynthesis adenylyltransferase
MSARDLRIGLLYDMDAIRRSSVTIVGGDSLAQHLIAYLCGLGVGNIRIVDPMPVTSPGPDQFIVRMAEPGAINQPRAKVLEAMVRTMNPEINVKGFAAPPDSYNIGNPDILIDTAPDPDVKFGALELFSQFQKNPAYNMGLFITGLATPTLGSLATCRSEPQSEPLSPKLNAIRKSMHRTTPSQAVFNKHAEHAKLELYKEVNGSPQSSHTASVIAAFMLDEVRKHFSPVNNEALQWFDVPLAERLNYTTKNGLAVFGGEPAQFYRQAKIQEAVLGVPERAEELDGLSAIVIGTGGTGSAVLTNLASTNLSTLTVVEFDHVDEHNLTRQFMFRPSDIGHSKGSTIVARLRMINPRIQYASVEEKLDEGNYMELLKGYDLIFCNVDNHKARKLISRAAVEYQTPVVNSGVTHTSAEVDSFFPKETYCIDCKNHYMEGAEGAEHPQGEVRESCDRRQVTIVPNLLAGTLSAELARKMLAVPRAKDIFSIRYSMNSKNLDHRLIFQTKYTRRFYVPNEGCKCQTYLE